MGGGRLRQVGARGKFIILTENATNERMVIDMVSVAEYIVVHAHFIVVVLSDGNRIFIQIKDGVRARCPLTGLNKVCNAVKVLVTISKTFQINGGIRVGTYTIGVREVFYSIARQGGCHLADETGIEINIIIYKLNVSRATTCGGDETDGENQNGSARHFILGLGCTECPLQFTNTQE